MSVLGADGKQTLQAIIDQFKGIPKTVLGFQQLVPTAMVAAIEGRFGLEHLESEIPLRMLQSNISQLEANWGGILQTISLQIILESARYAPIQDGIRHINRDAILAGYTSLYTNSYPITFKFSGASGLNHAMMTYILNSYGLLEVGSGVGGSGVGGSGVGGSGVGGSGVGGSGVGGSGVGGSMLGIVFLEYNPGTSKFTKADTLLRCVIKNLLADTKQVIVNKELLYGAMLAENPAVTARTMAATRKLTPDVRIGMGKLNTWEELKPLLGEVAIVRPVGAMACCGRGISVVTNQSELNQARLLVKPYPSAIISTYIQNPLLWHGRKFHIRMYLLIRAGTPSIPYHYELWTRGKILTALLPYQHGSWDQRSRLGGSETTSHSWNNKHIHDTHSDTTPHNLWFPEDLPDINRRQEIYAKMMESVDVVGSIMRKNVTMYPESIYAYEVFGCDFLVTDSYAVYLLEINDHVGFKPVREPPVYTHNELTTYYRDGRYTYDDFSFDYYTWVASLGILPIYFPQTPIPNTPSFGIDTLSTPPS